MRDLSAADEKCSENKSSTNDLVRHNFNAKIVISESQTVTHTENLQINYTYSARFNGTIQAASSQYEVYRSSEALPGLPDTASRFKWFRSHFSPQSVLEDILRSATSPSDCHRISQRDIQQVVGYCNYRGYLLHVNRVALAQVSFKILAHLCEHKWHLPEATVGVILSEVRTELNSSNASRGTLNYALLALGFLVNNRQCLNSDLGKLLDRGINRLNRLKPLDYLETIVILLAAKTHLGLRLSTEELMLVERAVIDVDSALMEKERIGDVPHWIGTALKHQYSSQRTAKKHSFPEKPKLSWWATQQGELSLIRNRTKVPLALSKYQWIYTLQQWKKTSSTQTKRLIIDIMRYAVANGQHLFPEQTKTLSVIQQALADSDLDIRQSAMVVADHLLIERDKLKDFPKWITTALHHQCRYYVSTKKSSFPQKPSVSWGTTQQGELFLIRERAKKRLDLSKDQWIYTLQQWKKTSSTQTKYLVIDIIRYAIANGQRLLSRLDKAFSVIKQALGYNDIDIRQSALVAANYLLLHGVTDIREQLVTALNRQREYALMTCHNLLNHKHFFSRERWLEIFATMQKDLHLTDKLRETAQFLRYRLTEKLSDCEAFILSPKFCIEVTKILLGAVQPPQSETLSVGIVQKLFQILQNEKFPKEAEINALRIFKHLAENKQNIDLSFMGFIVEKYLSTDNVAPQNITLIFMGHCVYQHLSHIQAHFLGLLQPLFAKKELQNNIFFVLDHVIDASKNIRGCHFEWFSNELTNLLFVENNANGLNKTVILLLHKAFQKGFSYSDKIIHKWGELLTVFEQDDEIRLQLLHLIGDVVDERLNIEGSDQFIESILKCCHSQNKIEKSDALHLLESYLRRIKTAAQRETIEKISEWVIETDSSMLGCQLFEPLVEKKTMIPDKVLCFIVSQLNQGSAEERTKILALLLYVIEYQPLPLGVLQEIMRALKVNHSRKVTELSVSIVKHSQKAQQYESWLTNDKDHLCLLALVKGFNTSLATKINAMEILRDLSLGMTNGFLLEFFHQLKDLLSHENDTISLMAAQVLKKQIIYLDIFILNKNTVIDELMRAVEYRLYSKHQQITLLEILKKAAGHGYHFSENISFKVAELLYTTINYEKRKAIRAFLHEQTLSGEAKTICVMDDDADKLAQNNLLFEQRLLALKRLASKAQAGEKMTQGVFISLKNLLQAGDQPLLREKDVSDLCEAILSKYPPIPSYVLSAMSAFMSRYPEHPSFKNFVKIVSLSITHHESVSHETFVNIEHLLNRENTTSDLLQLSLQALNIGVKREFVFQAPTLNKLLVLMAHSDSQIAIEAMCVLASFFEIHRTNHEFETLLVNKCFVLLQKSEEPNANHALQKLILVLSHFIKFDSVMLEIMQKKICDIQAFKQQWPLLMTLSSQQSKQKLAKDKQSLVAYKKQEKQFLSKETNLEQKIQLLETLSKNLTLLSGDSFSLIVDLFNTDDEGNLSSILKALTAQPKLGLLPNVLIEALAKIFQRPFTSHFEENIFPLTKKIVMEQVKNQKEFSIRDLDRFNSIMISHEEKTVRDFFYDLLKSIIKYQKNIPSLIANQIAMEHLGATLNQIQPIGEKRKIIRFMGTAIAKGERFSISNSETLLWLMRMRPELIKDILTLWGLMKEKLPKHLHSLMVQTLSDYFSCENEKFYDPRIVPLCCYFLNSKGVPKSVADQVLCGFSKRIESTQVETLQLTQVDLQLWECLTGYSLDRDPTKVLIHFLEYFLRNSDHRLQLKILSIIYHYLLSTETPSIELVRVLTKLKPKLMKKCDEVSTHFSSNQNRAQIKSYAAGIFSQLCSLFEGKFEDNLTDKNYDSTLPSIDRIRKQCGEQCLPFIYKFSNKKHQAYVIWTWLSLDTPVSLDKLADKSVNDYPQILLFENLVNLCHQIDPSCSEQERKRFYSLVLEISRNLDSHRNDLNKTVCHVLRLLTVLQKKEKLSIGDILELMPILIHMNYPFASNFMALRVKDIKFMALTALLNKLYSNVKTSLSHNCIIDLNNYFCQHQWHFTLIQLFFSKLKTHTHYDDIVSFLMFMQDHDIALDTLEGCLTDGFKDSACDLNDLKNHLIQMVFSNCLKKLTRHETENKTKNLIYTGLLNLCNYGWNAEKLMTFLQGLSNSNCSSIRISELYKVINMVFRYRQYLKESEFYDCYQQTNGHEFITSLHARIVGKCFKNKGSDKSLEQLLYELQQDRLEINHRGETNLLTNSQIKSFFKTVTKRYLSKESLILKDKQPSNMNNKSISQWTKKNILLWAKIFRDKRLNYKATLADPNLLSEMFAVLKRACVLQFTYEPRIVQLLSILLLLLGKKEHRGFFAQISTGEGKSLIIAMLATIRALFHQKVDIITSSPILAKEDVEHFSTFYALFNLKTACNYDQSYITGLKACYQNNIDLVYGDASEFQFDLLRHEYSQLGTRGKRPLETVIVDEVDNLLIDEGSKIAMLSTPVPSMDALTKLLSSLWSHLCKLDQAWNHPELDFEGQKNPFFELLKKKMSTTERDRQKKICLQRALVCYVEYMITDKNAPISIPNHLKAFASGQKLKWTENAWAAFYICEVETNYKIGVNKYGNRSIIPVDFSNTGIAQEGTVWADGLQQFLQLKHGLQVTPENLTTNYESNVSLMKRYQGDITAITGTVGSLESQKLLDDIYGIDLLKIPTYLPKQFVELPGEIIDGEENWVHSISNSAIQEAGQGRVVLIICESIKKAGRLQAALQKQFTGRCYIYADNLRDHSQFLNQQLAGNSIIVATNLAGRGTDIKVTPEVNKNGGLHVCMTFLPANLRVKQQALGRTSRCGQPGTAQLIINKQKLMTVFPAADPNKLGIDFSYIEQCRDRAESARIERVKKSEGPIIELKDELFECYLTLRKKIEVADKGKSIPSTYAKRCLDIQMKIFMKNALEEQWGLWLKKCDFSKEKTQILASFAQFEAKVLIQYKHNTLIKNPIYYLRIGHALLSRARSFFSIGYRDGLYKEALWAYEQAIKLDPLYAHNALYHKAYALAKLANCSYKYQIKSSLEKLLEYYKTLMQEEQVILHSLSQVKDPKTENHHLTQIQNRLSVYQLLSNSVMYSLQTIEESFRLISLNQYDSKGSSLCHARLSKQQALEVLEKYRGSLSVTFHHLKTHYDVVEFSQMRKTIAIIPENSAINITFNSEQFGQAYGLAQLLPINHYHRTEESLVEMDIKSRDEEEPETLFGFTAHVSAATSWLWNKGAGVCKAVGNRISEIRSSVAERCYNYREAEKIPVSLLLNVNSIAKIAELLETFSEYSDLSYELIFSNFSKDFIGFLQSKNYPLLIQLRALISKEDGAQYATVALQKVNTTNDTMIEFISSTQMQILKLNYQQVLALILDFRANHEMVTHGLDDATISLKLKKLSQPQAQTVMQRCHCKMKLCYERLSRKQAGLLLNWMPPEHHKRAFTEVTDLDTKQAQELIAHAARSVQDLTPKHKSIQDELMRISNNNEFLAALARNGYLYFYDLDEKNPFPIISTMMLSVAVIGQLSGGVALAALTAGLASSIGFSVATEGIRDIFRLVQTIRSREFSLSQYVFEKNISLALSISMASIAHAFTTAAAAGQAADTTVDYSDDAVRAAITMNASKEIGKHTSKQGLIEALKKMSISSAETMFTRVMDAGSNQITTHILQAMAPSMMDSTSREIKLLFERHSDWKDMLNHVLAVDKFVGSEMQNSVSTKIRNLIANLPWGQDSAIAQFENDFSKFLSETQRTKLSDFEAILKNKYQAEGIKADQIKRMSDLLSQQGIVMKNGRIDLRKLITICDSQQERITKFRFNRKHYDINHYNLTKIKWDKKLSFHRKKIIAACLEYHQYMQDDHFNLYNEMKKDIVNLFTDRAMAEATLAVNGVKSLLSSAISCGVSQATDAISRDNQNNLLTSEETRQYEVQQIISSDDGCTFESSGCNKGNISSIGSLERVGQGDTGSGSQVPTVLSSKNLSQSNPRSMHYRLFALSHPDTNNHNDAAHPTEAISGSLQIRRFEDLPKKSSDESVKSCPSGYTQSTAAFFLSATADRKKRQSGSSAVGQDEKIRTSPR